MDDVSTPNKQFRPARRLDLPALAAGYRSVVIAAADGSVETLAPLEAIQRISEGLLPIVCHAPATTRRLNSSPFSTLDILELYAFVRPAHFCRPTPSGIADALELNQPGGLEDEVRLLQIASGVLLTELIRMEPSRERDLVRETAQVMAVGKWGWAPLVLRALA
ncbi:MAG: ATP-dependent DNA helicase, partial [Pseudomonadota bacterium]|nr:ATP-dependent DNA helicase [Pseudomonadota bacterium]